MKVGFLISARVSLNLKSEHFTSSFEQKTNKELTAHYEPNLTTTSHMLLYSLGYNLRKSMSSKQVLGVAKTHSKQSHVFFPQSQYGYILSKIRRCCDEIGLLSPLVTFVMWHVTHHPDIGYLGGQ